MDSEIIPVIGHKVNKHRIDFIIGSIAVGEVDRPSQDHRQSDATEM